MTFYDYMWKFHRGEDTPEGDLASDMYADRECFPRGRDTNIGHEEIKAYLEDSGACYKCLEVFEECWEEYLEYEKNDQKKEERDAIQQRINKGRVRSIYGDLVSGCW